MVAAGTASLLATALSAVAAPPAKAPAKPDPQMAAVLRKLDELAPRPLPTLTPAQARKEPGAKTASTEILKARNGGRVVPEPVAKVEDRTYPAPDGPRLLRVYTPLVDGKAPTGPLPVVVFVHGGGWTIGSVARYDPSARALANAAGAVVASVSYRLAPEAKFPSALDDVSAAFRYVKANAAAMGGDPARVALAGESAGGNLTAAYCLRARDRGEPLPVHQALVYPPLDTRTDTPAYRTYANAKPLDKPQMLYFFKHYARTPADLRSPYVAPLRARSLRGLPPATIVTAQIDPLADDGRRYAERLRAAGVSVRFREYPGVTHEFFSMGGVVNKAKQAVGFCADGLRSSFEKAGTTRLPARP